MINLKLSQQFELLDFIKLYNSIDEKIAREFLRINIKKYAKLHKVKFKEIADNIGISYYTLQAITKVINYNNYKPNFEIFLSICNYVEVNIREFEEFLNTKLK
jgi:DNA-binding XRE family transcriptional regulator